jgi:predicted phosphodiesterase
MTHIGGYPGRYSPGVKRILFENQINLMVTGHSHILKVMWDKEISVLHINPGAAGYHGWQKERTLIRLVIDNGNMRDLEVIELGKVKC